MLVQSTSTRESRAWTISKVLIAVAIALFVITRFYMLFFFHPFISDIVLYYGYATKAIDLRQTPYTQDFMVPYPPLAYWTTCVPRMFDERRIKSTQEPQKTLMYFEYTRGFRGMMFLCDLASFVMLLLIVRKRRPQMAGWAGLLYVITTAILGNLLYDRIDVALLMFMMLGVYCWTRSLRESRWAVHWATLSYAIIGLGVSFKVIPLIIVPFFLLADFHTPRRFIRLGSALAVLAASIGVPFLIQWSATGRGVFHVFKFHAEREIELESLYSSLMSIASNFGSKVFVSFSHGANDLSGDLGHTMKILSTVLLLVFLAVEGLWALMRWSRYTRQDAYRIACYVIPGSVIFSNVLSPQYFIWAFPLLLLLAVEIFPKGIVSPLILAGLLIALAVMTTWIFPYNYFGDGSHPHALIPLNAVPLFLPPAPMPTFILGFRNFAYLGVVLWLGVMLYKRIDQVNDSSGVWSAPGIRDARSFTRAMNAVSRLISSSGDCLP
jgi:phosphate/sulfate permease